MNYKEARDYIKRAEGNGIVLGLDVMKTLLAYMGNPQDQLKFVHIAGTNGKGSVLAYVSTVLSDAGIRTGRYISPALFGYEERIQIDGQWIPQQMVAEGITEIARCIEQMAYLPTVFEIETALAFWYFNKKNCRIVVLETGMGGDMDATNIVKTTVCAAITSISVDHRAILGDTLVKIALHKAGIIKPGIPVVLMRQNREVEAVVKARCNELGAELILADGEQANVLECSLAEQVISYKNQKPVHTHLMGTFQKDNLAVALEVLEQLKRQGFEISDEHLIEGVAQTRWRGRLELIRKDPVLIVDGAHNPDAARKLYKSLEMYFTNQKFIFIIGVLADKEYNEIIRIMMPLAERVITITPDNPRALKAEVLKAAIQEEMPTLKISAGKTMADAWEEASQTARQENYIIVAFGSLSFIAQLVSCADGGNNG